MNERDLFLQALDLTDPAARAALLDRECADNPDLRRGVEALLSADAAAGAFLDQPHPAAAQVDAGATGPELRNRRRRVNG